MYTIQSPSGITIVMDAAFYLCAIRVTIFFSLVVRAHRTSCPSGHLFFEEKTGEQKRIVYKEIRMKQRTTNVHWLSQYRKSNPPTKIITFFTNITTNSRTFAICLRQGRVFCRFFRSRQPLPGALTAILARTTRSDQGDYQSVL